MSFTIDIRPLARDDILRVVRRIARTVSPASAARWNNGIFTKINTLSRQPERCPLADEAATLGFDLRVLLYGRGRHVYRILFTIYGNTVNVLRVRHAAQDWLTEDDV
jgi:plasmid stabilization system protein ParE